MNDNGIYDEIYGKLINIINIIFIAGWGIVTLIEFIIGIFIIQSPDFTNELFKGYFLPYVIAPAGSNLVVIIVTLILLKSKKIQPRIKNYVVITSLFLIALVLALVHHYFLAMLGAFVIPILVSILFLDYKTFTYGNVLSTLGILTSTIANMFLTPERERSGNLYTWGSAIIVLLICILVAIIVFLDVQIHRQREKILVQMQSENAKLVKENRADGLTGLQNHTSFYSVLEAKLSKARRDKRGFAIAMLDIDDFKNINDTYGHGVGDDILKYVSDTIVTAIDKCGVPFRYGGDEFAIIFNNPNPEANVAALEVLRKAVADNDSLFLDGTRVSLSIGYYNVKEAQMTSEEIFYRADQALYQAKYNGKNQVYPVY